MARATPRVAGATLQSMAGGPATSGAEQPGGVAPALPAGTVTFLFTDIAGSTQLWEQHPSAMHAALVRHDAIVLEAIHTHSGVAFKTVGDGVHAAFARAGDALEAALAAQRGLAAEPWGETGPLRVRMALHSGAAVLRDGDYFGPPLNRIARILGLGHGGQILLSHTSHDFVVDDLPPQTSLCDLGQYSLKDLSRAEQIFQAVTPDLPADFPPLRTLGDPGSTQQAAPSPLLATKLYIPPPRPQLVARPRLVERLQAGLAGKLTLITAPAGFGKTTLVSEWCTMQSGSDVQVAWVSLDAGDNDATRFWSYLIAALEQLQPGVGATALALLQSPQPPPIDAVLTPLLNALSAMPADAALILDDYHLIDTPPIHTALTFLLDHLPPQLHLIMLTRADPPIPLTRLRTRAELTELRATDLRFTADEAAAFLTATMRLSLTSDEVAALEARTEGWIAGLQLAALAMRDHRDIAGFINAFTGSNRFVVDYLAEEVLNRLPGDLQTFLLKTAVLDRMCGPLCDTMLGLTPDERLMTKDERRTEVRESVVNIDHQLLSFVLRPSSDSYSQALLEHLERANLFIVPLDDKRQWYRYHHLFAEVLRGRLTSGTTAAMVATLHRHASAWFEDQGFVAEAVHHALAANDGDQAARLVELHGDAVSMRGGLATLLGWLTALPDVVFETRPKLALNHAFILAALDDFALSERRLAVAERALQAAAVPDVTLLGQAAVSRAIIALQADYPAKVTIAAGRQALELLPASSATWRGLAGVLLGVGYYAQAGNLELGLQTLVEAEQVGLRAGDPFTVANALAHVTIVLEVGGRLRESERLNQHYLQRASEPFWQGVPLAGYARFGLSRVLYERNELHAARDHLTEALAQLEAWSLKRPIIITCVLLARVHQALGEPEHAREWMDRAVAIIEKDDLKQTFSHWASYWARMNLAQGDWSAAAQWAQDIEPSTAGELNPAHEFKHITLAQIALAQQRLDEAQRLLARLLPAAEAAGRMGRVLEIIILQALTADAQGNQAEAFTSLERALALAEPEGYIRSFVDAGAPMAGLLARSVALWPIRPIRQAQDGQAQEPRKAQSDSAGRYAELLLAAFSEGRAGARKAENNDQPVLRSALERSNALVEPLSVREIEILQLIAAGRSNQEIADRLVIAVSTVKKHVNNLYGKLHVQSRTQALLRAGELKLL